MWTTPSSCRNFKPSIRHWTIKREVVCGYRWAHQLVRCQVRGLLMESKLFRVNVGNESLEVFKGAGMEIYMVEEILEWADCKR